jgi:hypothetical protein
MCRDCEDANVGQLNGKYLRDGNNQWVIEDEADEALLWYADQQGLNGTSTLDTLDEYVEAVAAYVDYHKLWMDDVSENCPTSSDRNTCLQRHDPVYGGCHWNDTAGECAGTTQACAIANCTLPYWIIHADNMILYSQRRCGRRTLGDGSSYALKFCGDCEDLAVLRASLVRVLGLDSACVWCADNWGVGELHIGHSFNLVVYRSKWRILDYESGSGFEATIDSFLSHRIPRHDDINNLWNDEAGTYNCNDWMALFGCNRIEPYPVAYNYQGGTVCPAGYDNRGDWGTAPFTYYVDGDDGIDGCP